MTTDEAGRLAGVGATAIKRWADSGLLPCVRTPGGHRRFRRRDVEQLAHRQQGGARAAELAPWTALLVSEGDARELEGRLLVERARQGSWVRVAQLLGEVLVDVGEQWAAGRLTVIQEHIASERLARALERIGESLPTPPGAPRCVLASAGGDDHTLGLSLVEICLREAGWSPLWLGNRTPVTEIVGRLRDGQIDMVALSASAASSDEGALAAQATALGVACRELGVTLALGGSGRWPDIPIYGARFRELDAFVGFAAGERRP